ncbi:arabinan endo-1,5-alpha-L-arabinosidase [Haloferula luteola]|uniref:Arabinan endo-1,5-alpha-L-arabinosidase n=1 Tax=Haloferula luteola TaxID=595692 RepID=A0A840V0S7_9BACT|nr:arabinan endo-1,5-alpha-L-arabinosidase [Haloferula luteola]MBB5351595.1 arabinan endo-1,5-alpha-L-arabinosidase [Haloferula luteola]
MMGFDGCRGWMVTAAVVGGLGGVGVEAAEGLPGGPLAQAASRGVVTRDPSTVVQSGDRFWVFYTGQGVHSMSSKDGVTWEPGPPVFREPPPWIAEAVPKNRGVYWAPDVMKVGDRFLLYYSVSSFGKMDSAIGLATNSTLDPASAAFQWTDEGEVVRSREGGDFNTIDPSIFHDADGRLWLVFGSQWSGLKLVELDPATGKRKDEQAPMVAVAAGVPIEAAYLYSREGLYYLFVNRGDCCRGDQSTYHIQVGRSSQIEGPYVDREGKGLLDGGGSLVLEMKVGPLTGPGHAGIVEMEGKSWFSCHFEADDRMGGKATLGLMPIRWSDDGWPEVLPPEDL